MRYTAFHCISFPQTCTLAVALTLPQLDDDVRNSLLPVFPLVLIQLTGWVCCLPQVQQCMNTEQRTCSQKWADNAQPLMVRKRRRTV